MTPMKPLISSGFFAFHDSNTDPISDFATPTRSIFKSGEKPVTVGSAGRCDMARGGLPTQSLSPAFLSTVAISAKWAFLSGISYVSLRFISLVFSSVFRIPSASIISITFSGEGTVHREPSV